MKPKSNRRAPATTSEAREQQIIAAAMDLAEQQILDGTVSSQVLSVFVRAGTERERLERVKIENDNRLTTAKIEGMANAKKNEEIYKQALDAMRTYSGQVVIDND